MKKEIEKKDNIYKEINNFLHTFELTNKDNISLYYIPKEYQKRDNNKDIIVINKDNKYYELEIIAIENSYELLGNLMNSLKDIENLVELTDIDIIDELNKKDNNQSYIEYKYEIQMKEKIKYIEDTLDKVLDTISLPARSNKTGFYDTSKLDAIEQLLENNNSKYKPIYKTNHCVIYGQKIPKYKENSIIVSSHSDIVKTITKVSSKKEDNYYHGTYDNLATNASAVTIMLNEKELPDNIYFTFTDEEETGRCLGAKDTLNYIQTTTHTNPLCIALDVTDEGYKENRLISIEGLNAIDTIKNKIKDIFMDLEGDKKSFNVVKYKKNDNSPFKKEYITCDSTVFDESVYYGKTLNQDALSLCIPTDGYMHSDIGLNIKESVFIGYILSLSTFLYEYAKEYQEVNYKNKEDIKEIKDYLVEQTIKQKNKPNNYYNQNTYIYNSYNNYDYNEEAYNESYFTTEDYNEDELIELFELATDFAKSYDIDERDIYIQEMSETYNFEIPLEIIEAGFREAHEEELKDSNYIDEDYYNALLSEDDFNIDNDDYER